MVAAVLQNTRLSSPMSSWLSAVSLVLLVTTGALIAGAFYSHSGELSVVLMFMAGGGLATAFDLIGSLRAMDQDRADWNEGQPLLRIDEERISSILADLYQRFAAGSRQAKKPDIGQETSGVEPLSVRVRPGTLRVS